MTDTERLDDIVARTARRFDVDPDALRTERDQAQNRYVAIYVAKENGIAVPVIQEYFGCSEFTVYNGIAVVRKRLEEEILLRSQIHNLVRGLDEHGLPENARARAEHQARAIARSEVEKIVEDDDQPEEDDKPVVKRKIPIGTLKGLEVVDEPTSEDPEEPDAEEVEDQLEPAAAGDVMHNAEHKLSKHPDGPAKSIPVATGPKPFANAEPTRPVELPRSNNQEAEDNRIPIAEILTSPDRLGAFRKRLEELRILKAKRAKSWDDAPVVRVGRDQLTIEVEDVRLVIRGHVALGSLKGVATLRTRRILEAITDGRFRIEEE